MSTLSRRDWLLSASALVAQSRLLAQEKLVAKPIPATGEKIPVIGLGSSATFSQVARREDVDALREVMKTLVAQGATVFDTAPGYGASEEVAGRIASEEKLTDKIFWATKLNVARGNGSADPAAAKVQIETSFNRIKKPKIDLIQVHNMGDPATQLPILRELKAAGRIRYLGITTTFPNQYESLIKVMKSETLDFVGINYAVDDRDVEQIILPLALDRKIAVLAYAPFGRTRLFRRVGDRPVPDWAADFNAKTWAQFFLKFVVSHPAITAATPATSQGKNMLDNIGGGIGKLPDEATRKKMAAFVESLPSA